MMNCEEISELLPAYVLGALEPDEVEAIEEHLRAGREHDEELVELRTTVFALDRYSDELSPGAIGAPVGGRIEASGTAPREAPETASRKRSGGSFLGAPAWGIAAIAAGVLLLFGAGWVAGQLLAGEGGETYAYAIEGEDGAFMEVLGDTASDSVTVTMAGLQRLEDRSYQVWAIRDGEWVSIGVCNTNAEGRWVGDFEFSLRTGERVALTVEPRGGSEMPTSDPVLISTY